MELHKWTKYNMHTEKLTNRVAIDGNMAGLFVYMHNCMNGQSTFMEK